MIQDILPLHLQNQYEKKQPDDTSYMMIYRENKILVGAGETLTFLIFRKFREICEAAGEMVPQSIYLFSVDAETYFLTELPEHLTLEGYCFEKMFAVRSGKPKEHIFAAATAWHLYEWYRDNRFCGRCGQKLMHDGTLRMLFCPACGSQVFPKIAPAVIDGRRVHSDDNLRQQGVQTVCAHRRIYGDRGDGGGDGHAGSAGGSRS